MWNKTHLVSESFVNPLFYFVLFGFKLFPYLEKLCCLFPYLLLLYTLHVSVSFCYPPSSFTLQGRGACPPLHFGEGTHVPSIFIFYFILFFFFLFSFFFFSFPLFHFYFIFFNFNFNFIISYNFIFN